jgi:hypothetical protein
VCRAAIERVEELPLEGGVEAHSDIVVAHAPFYDPTFEYRVGAEVLVAGFDPSSTPMCNRGVHAWLRRDDPDIPIYMGLMADPLYPERYRRAVAYIHALRALGRLSALRVPFLAGGLAPIVALPPAVAAPAAAPGALGQNPSPPPRLDPEPVVGLPPHPPVEYGARPRAMVMIDEYSDEEEEEKSTAEGQQAADRRPAWLPLGGLVPGGPDILLDDEEEGQDADGSSGGDLREFGAIADLVRDRVPHLRGRPATDVRAFLGELLARHDAEEERKEPFRLPSPPLPLPLPTLENEPADQVEWPEEHEDEEEGREASAHADGDA